VGFSGDSDCSMMFLSGGDQHRVSLGYFVTWPWLGGDVNRMADLLIRLLFTCCAAHGVYCTTRLHLC
jgi:hypothetical protein